MKKNVKIFLCVALVLVAIMALAACGGNSKLTKANFDKITCGTLNYDTMKYEGGMTLDEVKAILGEPTESASSTVMGSTTTAYVWKSASKGITVTLADGIAVSKAQTGLK